MELQDDRTPEQKKTHTVIVLGTDTFMSGWGKAQGGVSYAGWACTPEQERACLERVESRAASMKRVRVIYGRYRPRGVGHCHIYVYKA